MFYLFIFSCVIDYFIRSYHQLAYAKNFVVLLFIVIYYYLLKRKNQN